MKTNNRIDRQIKIAEACDKWYNDNVHVSDRNGEEHGTLSYYKGIKDALEWFQRNTEHPLLDENSEDECRKLIEGEEGEEDD